MIISLFFPDLGGPVTSKVRNQYFNLVASACTQERGGTIIKLYIYRKKGGGVDVMLEPQ